MSFISFVGVVFVCKVKRIPSEENSFFGSLCLSISVEHFIAEFVHIDINCVLETLFLHMLSVQNVRMSGALTLHIQRS